MKAGELDKKVAVQQLTETADGQGGFTESWATVIEPWAKIRPFSSKEKFFAGQVRAGVTHEVTLRYSSSVTTKGRILWGSRVFDIKGMLNIDERNEKLVLECAEVQG
jgi:SPP1 family predicted phage head-tail adaptor